MHISSFMLSVTTFFLYFSKCISFTVDSIGPLESISDGATLVSKRGKFEFGFFSPGNPKNRYVGIWFKNIPVQTVVWVANRCNPVNDSSGLLMINNTGNLVLLNQNKSVVWSTSSSKQVKKPLVQLLDSGNLVLRDDEGRDSESYLWQSFDYPSDTSLPGMKIGWDLSTGLNRRLTAWKNWDDPCPGDLSWEIRFNDAQLRKNPETYIMKGKLKLYRASPWNGLGFSGFPDLKSTQPFDYQVVDNEDEVYSMYIATNTSVISRMVMNQTTTTRQRFTWMDQNWRLYSSVPRDSCDTYGRCGANGYCAKNGNPLCQCLKGFKPKSPENWNLRDWSEGCVRDIPLNCSYKGKEKDGFMKLVGLKMPDTLYALRNKSMNLKECRAKCLRNCSCMAYANFDIRGTGSGCIIWFGDLIDVRTIIPPAQDLYIRMPASELEKGKSHAKVRAVVGVVASIGGVFGMIVLGYFICRTSSKDRNTKKDKTRDQSEDNMELPLIELSTIILATNNFSSSNKLGQGGFGPVYRGKLEDGQEIAVKRLSASSGQGIEEFKNEVILIAKLQHRNLVKLLGCCIEGEENLLVYEYMPNKSLDAFIFDQNQGRVLEWSKRFQILCGIARGLLYLHQDSRLRIIHRDLKTSNILLDNEMNPKISDFGMARSFGADQTEGKTNIVAGTYGYMAPEYAFRGLFSIKSDVFSFGIMVLEIISGMRSRGFRPQQNGRTLTGYAWTLMQQGRGIELLDSCLRNSHHDFQEVLRCIHIGLLCVQQSANDRPDMSSVILMLGSDSHILPQSKRPGYFMETELPQGCPESSLTNDMTMSVLEAR